jgi:hypothetical protein
MLLFSVTILLSAFLLFQIQPVIAKIILPWFGGSSAVWNTCMLFFQGVLLLGYLYAHLLHEKLRPRWQALAHSLLLAASLGSLPALVRASWAGSPSMHPSWQIIGLLAATVGGPYFMLSTTTPLLQAWYARSHRQAMPYRLYALSNFASLIALLSYPLIIEPNLTVHHQAATWSALYILFTLLCATTAWRNLWPGKAEEAWATPSAEGSIGEKPRWGALSLWILLPACASILLLSTTEYLTQDVAAIPFLWILPLSVYLLSFIICFEAPRLYWRPLYYPALAAALWADGYVRYWREDSLGVLPTVSIACSGLFIFCMVCHGELARSKPHPRYLTLFYVMVSVGGAMGGLLVAIVAPNVFNGYYEFPVGLVLCACLAAWILLKQYWKFRKAVWGPATIVAVLMLIGTYTLALAKGITEEIANCRLVVRNFYGELRVFDADEEDGLGHHRKLMHGMINHGEQILSPQCSKLPTTYYCPGTGIADLLADGVQGAPRRVGMIGLGCGTMTVYGRPGDLFRLYEINPLVVKLAQTQFTYLKDTPAKVEIILGDGRVMLERERDQHFDFLLIDAFSGDSIPIHLLTKEAFQTYFRHLQPDGVLALHISNKYLNLEPVVGKAASCFGKVAVLFDFEAPENDTRCFSASWVLVMSQKGLDRYAAVLAKGQRLGKWPNFRLWTDDYSGIYGVLK